MLKKIFIFVFLSASFAVWATPCDTLNSLQIPDTLQVCRWDTIRFQSNNSLLQAPLQYIWHTSSNTVNTPYLPITNGNPSGEVWVEISDSAQTCSRTDTFFINITPVPQVTRPPIDTMLCPGDTFVIYNGNPLFTDSSRWLNPFSSSPVYIGKDSIVVVFDSIKSSTNTYLYVVEHIGYCQKLPLGNIFAYVAYDTAEIYFANHPIVDLGTDTTACDDGNGIALTALSPTLFLPEKYQFLWHNNNQENTLTVNVEQKGWQAVNVWNEVCMDTVSDSIYIDFWPKEWTESGLITDTSLCEEERLTLNATVATPNQTTYYWEHDSLNTNPILVDVEIPGTYTVVVTDSAGCVRKFTCEVALDDCDPKLEMPNIFTPNGDGVNEIFKPILHEKLKKFRLRIYNRHGREVYRFEGDAENAAWNGNKGNRPVPDGVYFWVVKYEDLFGKSYDLRGSVTILR